MIVPVNPRGLIATKPVEFRKGMDGLAALVAAEMKLDPFSAAVGIRFGLIGDRLHSRGTTSGARGCPSSIAGIGSMRRVLPRQLP